MNCFARRFLATRLLRVVLSVVSLAGISGAQSTAAQLRVDIPFDFENGSHRYAAGVYFVHVDEDRRLTLDGATDRLVTGTIPDESMNVATKSSVVFRRYGDHYFLREVWIAGRKTHVHCPPSKTEKQVEIALRTKNKPGVTVALLDTSK